MADSSCEGNTDKSTQFNQATEQWQPQKTLKLKCLSADEKTLSDHFIYKNKHVPCFILLILYSLKYMFYY